MENGKRRTILNFFLLEVIEVFKRLFSLAETRGRGDFLLLLLPVKKSKCADVDVSAPNFRVPAKKVEESKS